LVVHDDALGCLLGRVAGLGHDERQRLADVANAIAGERPLQIAVEPRQRGDADGNRRPEIAEVGEGEHREHAGHPQRRRDVDAGDARVGDGAADDHGVAMLGRDDIGDVAAAAGDEAMILAAAHGRAHEALAGWLRVWWVYRLLVHTYNRSTWGPDMAPKPPTLGAPRQSRGAPRSCARLAHGEVAHGS